MRKQARKSAKMAYRAATFALALLMTTGWYVFDHLTDQQDGQAVEINVAGRQRMLTQRISVLAFELGRAHPSQEQEFRGLLAGCASLLRRSHETLLSRDVAALQAISREGVSCEVRQPVPRSVAPLSKPLYAAYFSGPDNLDSMLQDFVHIAIELAKEGKVDALRQERIAAMALHDLPTKLDDIVTILQQEAEQAQSQLESVMAILWLLGLVILGLLYVLILTPMMRQLDDFVARMVRLIRHLRSNRQALVQAKKQAEAGSEAKTLFLATMSHEVRTPLNGILGMSEVLAQGDMTSEQRKQLRVIKQSGRRLMEMVDNVLEMSRADTGAVNPKPEPVALRPLIDAVIHDFKARFADKHLYLEFETWLQYEDEAVIDPLMLRQILHNLLSNALKFTKTGGCVVSAALYRDNTDVRRLTLQVTDTGIGIPAHKLDHIFAPFEQADSELTRHHDGSGLGLTICRQLAIQMEGNVSVKAGNVGGASFSLDILAPEKPTQNGADAQEPEAATHVPGESPAHILVVEDNPVNAKIAEALLEGLGYHVTVTENGRGAINAVKTNNNGANNNEIDLVLMDIHMPVMDGVTATRLIRETMTAAELPIIALTAESMDTRHQTFLDAGMNAVMTKPFSRTDLQRLLTRHIPKPAIR